MIILGHVSFVRPCLVATCIVWKHPCNGSYFAVPKKPEFMSSLPP